MQNDRVLHARELRAQEFARLDRARTIVTLPVSPLEVHGPHLPLMTDALEAEALLDSAMERFLTRHRDAVHLKLPPLHLGADVLPQTGSIAARPSTVRRAVEDTGRSLARQGFRHIWIGNFHAGPRHFLALEAACEKVNRKYGASMVSVFSLLIAHLKRSNQSLADIFAGVPGLSASDLEGDAHAGVLETSLLLHLRGDRVDPAYRDLPRNIDAPEPSGSPVIRTFQSLFSSMRYYRNNTYAGAPAGASAELGARALDIMARLAEQELSELYLGRTSPAHGRSPLWPLHRLFLAEPLGWVVERMARYDAKVF